MQIYKKISNLNKSIDILFIKHEHVRTHAMYKYKWPIERDFLPNLGVDFKATVTKMLFVKNLQTIIQRSHKLLKCMSYYVNLP